MVETYLPIVLSRTQAEHLATLLTAITLATADSPGSMATFELLSEITQAIMRDGIERSVNKAG